MGKIIKFRHSKGGFRIINSNPKKDLAYYLDNLKKFYKENHMSMIFSCRYSPSIWNFSMNFDTTSGSISSSTKSRYNGPDIISDSKLLSFYDAHTKTYWIDIDLENTYNSIEYAGNKWWSHGDDETISLFLRWYNRDHLINKIVDQST